MSPLNLFIRIELIKLILPAIDSRFSVDFLEIAVNPLDKFVFCFTLMPFSICLVILLKNPSIRFSQEACLGVNTNSNRPVIVVRYFLVSSDV